MFKLELKVYFQYYLSSVLVSHIHAFKCYNTLRNGTVVVEEATDKELCMINKLEGEQSIFKGLGAGQSGVVCKKDNRNTSETQCFCGTDLCNDKFRQGVMMDEKEPIKCKKNFEADGDYFVEMTTCSTRGQCSAISMGKNSSTNMYFCSDTPILGPEEQCLQIYPDNHNQPAIQPSDSKPKRSNRKAKRDSATQGNEMEFMLFCTCATDMCEPFESKQAPHNTNEDTAENSQVRTSPMMLVLLMMISRMTLYF